MAYQPNNSNDDYSEYIVLQMLHLKVGSKEDCIRACKAVKNRSLNEAVDWLMQHPNDDNGNSWKWGFNRSNNNNNNHYRNSIRFKINEIKNKYPELEEVQIRELLDRHNGDLTNTLKFIQLKLQQKQERDRQLALQRRREQEQKQDPTETSKAKQTMFTYERVEFNLQNYNIEDSDNSVYCSS
eukprot:195673_1